MLYVYFWVHGLHPFFLGTLLINFFACLSKKKKKKKNREREKKEKAKKKEKKTAKEEKLAKYSLFVSSWNDVQCAYLLISLI